MFSWPWRMPKPSISPECSQTRRDVFTGMAGLEWPLPAEPVGLWLLVWWPGSHSSQIPNLQEFLLSVRDIFSPWSCSTGRGDLGLFLSGVIPNPRGFVPVSPALGHFHFPWKILRDLQRSFPTPKIPGFWGIKQLQELAWKGEPRFSTKLLLCHKEIGKGKVPSWEKWDGQEGSRYGINHSVPSSSPGGFGHQEKCWSVEERGKLGVRGRSHQRKSFPAQHKENQEKKKSDLFKVNQDNLGMQRTKSSSPGLCRGEAENSWHAGSSAPEVREARPHLNPQKNLGKGSAGCIEMPSLG